jgi:hypothetical protein
MMQIRLWALAALLLGIPLPGKAQSIQPFYSSDDVVFKQELVGRWEVEGVILEFRDLGDKAYGIKLFGDNDVVIQFRVHLMQLGGRFFLDGQISGIDVPDKEEAQGKATEKPMAVKNGGFSIDEHDIFLNRHHGLILMEFTKNKDEFILRLWEDSWLPSMAEKKQLACPYVKDELGRILLTGETAELRNFVERLPVDAFAAGQTATRYVEEESRVTTRKNSANAK